MLKCQDFTTSVYGITAKIFYPILTKPCLYHVTQIFVVVVFV